MRDHLMDATASRAILLEGHFPARASAPHAGRSASPILGNGRVEKMTSTGTSK